MRRARISIKPNVRPGGRSVGPSPEDKSSQDSPAVDDTQKTVSPPPQSQPEVKESAEAIGDGHFPGSPTEKAALNTDSKDRAPSSAKTTATPALQRRGRLSVAPNLARPKLRSTADPPPSANKTASLPSESSKTSSPIQAPKSFPQPPVPVAISEDVSQNSKFSGSTAAAHCPPSSPCLLSISGCPESPSFTSSHQEPCKSPLKIQSKDVGLLEGGAPAPSTFSPYVKLSRVDGPGSPLREKILSDKERVLRALKLKELMKMERSKERMQRRGRHKREHVYEMDPDKMTLADFIYYIPDTNPMKSSLSTEEVQTAPTATAISPSPLVQKYMADEDDDDADDDMLVPKVRVAEDGSLILDEESLTVRVQRASDTVIDNTNLLFERGSTTTYSSFRKNYHVKNWSVRETDMFYLAISMVGTDFSMMAQLLTHRNRTEIKSKFKKEEKENAWRVDKAFREKRPYDAEFFSFLLKRILAKDKEKGKAIKLVVKPSKAKKPKSKGGKKAKEIVEDFMSDNDCDELCSVDSGSFDLEKENEDCSNLKEADVQSAKKRKGKKDKQCEKTSKPRKTLKKGVCSIDDEDECVDNDLVEVDPVGADNEDQSCMPVSKKKRKRSKKDDQEEQKEKADAKVKRQKKNKKTLKVQNEEHADGESEAVNEEHSEVSTIPNKKRKRSKKSEKEDEDPTKQKPKTKKSKTSPQDFSGSEPGAEGIEISAAATSAEGDHGEMLNQDSAVQEISKSSSKRSKKPLPKLVKRKSKKCTEPQAAEEMEDAVEQPEDESCTDAGNKSRILLAEEQLQKQPVVVLERTPPRLKESYNSTESQDGPQSSKSPQCSPGRKMRAEKVKRNLSAADGGREVHSCEEDHRENLSPESSAQEAASQSFSRHSPSWQTRAAKVKPDLAPSEREQMEQFKARSDSSAEDISSTAIPDQIVSQDSEVMGADQCTEEEEYNLQSVTSSEVIGQTFLKKAVVSVSHEEVQHYLRVQAQNTAEESTASESLQDTTPDRRHQVEENREGFKEQGSSSVTVSQEAEMKESPTASVSAQQSITATRRRVLKPTPRLSREAQSSRRPLNVQTIESSQNTSSLKEQVNLTPNENIEEEHRDCPEEEDTHSVSPQENSSHDVQDDLRSTADDSPSTSSVEIPETVDKPMACNTDVPERKTELAASPAPIFEIEDQIRDQEEQDSEFEITESTINEIMTEIKRSIPVSFSGDETHCQIAKPTSSIECEPQVSVSPQHTSEPNEDSAKKPDHQSPSIAQHSDLDQGIEPFSGEDKPVSSVVDLRECKQDEDLLCPVPLLNSTQTPVPVVSAGTEIKQQNNPAFSDASLEPLKPQSLDSSISDHLTQHTSNLLMFSVPAAENIQIPDKQDSAKQDCAEEQSSVSENWSVPLDGDSKAEISISSGVETGASDYQAEEPTFILTLYEIPTSELFSEGISGEQDTLPYELQPAQVHTPSRLKGNSQTPSFTEEPSSASLHMASEEPEKPGESVSCEDDPLVCLSKYPENASTQLIYTQESSYDGVNSLICPSEMLSATLTDVPNLDETTTKASETKAPAQRRSKIKIKPKLKPCLKAGPSRNVQLDPASSQSPPSSHAKAETESESKQKTSAQETIDPKIHSDPEDSELGAHSGHDCVVSVATVPVSEEMTVEHPLQIEVDQMDQVFPVHSTVMDVSKDRSDYGCEGVSHMVLADTFMLSSGEIDSVLNVLESPNNSELQEEREKVVLEVNDQKETMGDIAGKQDSCLKTSSVLPSTFQEQSKPFSRCKLTSPTEDMSSQEQSDIGFNDPATAQIISPEPLIKEELEERTEQEEDVSEEELDARPALMTLSTQDLTSFTSEKSLACSDSPSVEMKKEGGSLDVTHIVLSDIFVPVSNETQDDVNMERGCSVQSVNQMGEEERRSYERVCHVVLTDILRSPRLTERPQLREEAQSSHAESSVSPKRNRPAQGKGTQCSKPTLSKRIDDPSETDLIPPSSAQSSLAAPQQSLDHQAEEWTFKSNMLPIDSDEIENWCEGVSHMLLSDAFVPVSEENEENNTNLKMFDSSSPHDNKEFARSPSIRRKTPSVISDNTPPIDSTTEIPEIGVSKESLPASQAKESPTTNTFHMTLRSPERCIKDQPKVQKSPQAASTTPQRTLTSKVKESVESPSRQHIGETSSLCRVQLERLSMEEIRAAQSVLQPKHHSTPVTVKTTSRGNETQIVSSLALLGSRSPGFELQAGEETHVPSGFSPKIVLHRIPITPTSSPARAPTASQTSADGQSPQSSPSAGESSKDPVQVSQFFLDDIFTEVEDTD
ncbi:uncharacterized protein bdp1 isoform X3 [Danio rerio]|uniref:Uncharacterized protein bdp1 isoform X3 n=1 Tax=Danio rerio TaxID=7955 RepID=A0A8M9PLE0_DANRE|nr:titin homolog isoform X3 [Danio rerio]|eukprot:XP_021332287.1 titin homolog isoform X3 [Danio rerio]